MDEFYQSLRREGREMMKKLRTGRRKVARWRRRQGEAGDDVKAVKSSEVEGILTSDGTSDESSEDK